MQRILIITVVLWGSISIPAQEQPADEMIYLPSNPCLSADGGNIIFAWRGDICRASAEGGEIDFLTRHPAREMLPVYSPDGSQIAFTSDRSGSNQVYVMPAQGGPARQITHHSAGSDLLCWYPDGRHILVSGQRDHDWRRQSRLFRVELMTGRETLIVDAYAENGRISPDCARFLFTREGVPWWRKGYTGSGAGQVWLYDLATGTFTLVLGHDGNYRWPIWSVDGRSIYYVASSNGDEAMNLWQCNLNGGDRRQLTHFTDDIILSPTLSGDGETMVFRHLFDLYRLRLDRKEEPTRIDLRLKPEDKPKETRRRYLRNCEEAAFTTDGLEIAFVANRDIWLMDTELREPVPLATTPLLEESEPVFSPDGKTLYFIRSDGVNVDVWKAARGDADRYWWQNTTFELTQLTADDAVEGGLSISPDGKHLAFRHKRDGLWICNADGGNLCKVLDAWSEVYYDWSPDSAWLAASVQSNEMIRDIWIAAVDGGREPYNVSRNPRNDFAPAFSPDGKLLAWTGWALEDQQDIYYVYLAKEAQDVTARSRLLEKAVEKIEKKRGKPKPKPSSPEDKDEPEVSPSTPVEDAQEQPDAVSDPNAVEPATPAAESVDKEEKEPKKTSAKKEPVKVTIDFEDITDRVRRIETKDVREYAPFWSPDSKKLLFIREYNNNYHDIYQVEFPDKLSPTRFAALNAEDCRWLKDAGGIVCRADNLPALIDPKGKLTKYPFTVKTDFDTRSWYELGFRTLWRLMRDDFYDPDLNHKDWNAMLAKYLDKAVNAPDLHTFRRVASLLLGELNASHLAIYGDLHEWESTDAWRNETAHLGVRFDPTFPGLGLKIRDVLPDSPAANEHSRLYTGELITHIDGTAVGEGDPTLLLNGPLDRDIVLTVEDTAGQNRSVTIRPISYSAAIPLVYKFTLERTRACVKELSGDRIGYLHIPQMRWEQFLTFEKEVYAEGMGRDALIIDVRGNTGGYIADHLLSILCQPAHSYIIPREGDLAVESGWRGTTIWYKPIVVLCDQNTFSNGEIFSHAIKTIGRGPLVGAPTHGGVITTGDRQLMGLGTLRHPYVGWYTLKERKNMELNGAVPDYIIWPEPGEMPAGVDRQLEKAVELLLKP
ncbi:MAG: PD40 domain-containing protein [Sedimentisphaerales bacterium]|nr:PD40 domain-containing protein [Sedimentisphaerales bacterium]